MSISPLILLQVNTAHLIERSQDEQSHTAGDKSYKVGDDGGGDVVRLQDSIVDCFRMEGHVTWDISAVDI